MKLMIYGSFSIRAIYISKNKLHFIIYQINNILDKRLLLKWNYTTFFILSEYKKYCENGGDVDNFTNVFLMLFNL